ncbi:MAG: hypothetical protein J2P35_07590, partial [Actinobacteria bacterium]|nr:hypothetical protein [Actinomycetota bacterium]
MTDPGRQHGLWPVPGDGVLARHGNLVLLSSIDEHGFIESLLDLLARTSEAGGDGRAFVDAIVAAVTGDRSWGSAQGWPAPALLAFGPAGAGMAVTVSGTAWAEITTGYGTSRLAAGQPSMLLRSVTGVVVQSVRGGLTARGEADRADRFSRLDSGTVRASGLSYVPGRPPSPARVAFPAPREAPSGQVSAREQQAAHPSPAQAGPPARPPDQPARVPSPQAPPPAAQPARAASSQAQPPQPPSARA